MQPHSSLDDKSLALGLVPSFQTWAENQPDVSGAYLVTWITFDAIYVSEYDKPYAEFKLNKNGDKHFVNRYGHGLDMVDVDTASERDMILHALRKIPKDIMQKLITLSLSDNEATCLEFFANRVPIWQGSEVKQDAKGQAVRGVINVRETISADYPRWVFVDSGSLTKVLERLRNGEDVDVPDHLICQVGDILYTVRNNLFHGCKGPEDSNDRGVLRNAYTLLRFVVDFYTDRMG